MKQQAKKFKRDHSKVGIGFTSFDYQSSLINTNWLAVMLIFIYLIGIYTYPYFGVHSGLFINVLIFQFVGVTLILNNQIKKLDCSRHDNIKSHISIKTLLGTRNCHILLTTLVVFGQNFASILPVLPAGNTFHLSTKFIENFEITVYTFTLFIVSYLFWSLISGIFIKKHKSDLTKNQVISEFMEYYKRYSFRMKVYLLIVIMLFLFFTVLTMYASIPYKVEFFTNSLFVTIGLVVFSFYLRSKNLIDIDHDKFIIHNYDSIVVTVNISKYGMFMALYFILYGMSFLKIKDFSVNLSYQSILGYITATISGLYPVIEAIKSRKEQLPLGQSHIQYK